MVVPANLNLQMVSYGTYFLDYGSICQYQTSRRDIIHAVHVLLQLCGEILKNNKFIENENQLVHFIG